MGIRKRAALVPSYLKHSAGNGRKKCQAWVIINGKVHYLGQYGSEASYRRYDQLIAEWLASSRSPAFGRDSDEIQIVDLMLAYLEYADGYYGSGDNSEAKRIRFALKPLERLYADLYVAEYGPVQYKATREHMIGLGWARTNINDSLKRIVRMIKWGAGEGMFPAAIHETLRLIPPLKRGRTEANESAPVTPVCEERVAATLPHCSPVVADMIRVQLLTGCRPGEVVKLTPAMIDRKGEVWVAILTEHKTAHHGKLRRIYMGPECQAIVKPYLLRGQDERLFQPRESEQKRRQALSEARTTPENQGNRPGYSKRLRQGETPKKTAGDAYTTQTYGRSIRYACSKAFPVPDEIAGNKAEVKKWREREWWAANQLRHTSATKLRERFGLDTAASILGHSKIETSQIYAEQSTEKAIAAALAIG